MEDSRHTYPACFGILENVFPEGEGGMRISPESCFPCYYKTDCLKKAMAGMDGLKIHEENIDRAYKAGMISFFERWSRKKLIHRKSKTGKV